MTDPAGEPVSAELLAWWWQRYRGLVELMERRPGDPSHWVWEVRRGVLAYLLRRYGTQMTVEQLARTEPTPPRRSAERGKRRLASPRPSRAQGAVPGAFPRGGSAFREKLEHLRRLNVNRPVPVGPTISAQPKAQKRAVRLSYPEEGFKLPGEELLAEQRAVLEREAAEIGRLIPGDRPLSEDEVVAVLMGCE